MTPQDRAVYTIRHEAYGAGVRWVVYVDAQRSRAFKIKKAARLWLRSLGVL